MNSSGNYLYDYDIQLVDVHINNIKENVASHCDVETVISL